MKWDGVAAVLSELGAVVLVAAVVAVGHAVEGVEDIACDVVAEAVDLVVAALVFEYCMGAGYKIQVVSTHLPAVLVVGTALEALAAEENHEVRKLDALVE